MASGGSPSPPAAEYDIDDIIHRLRSVSPLDQYPKSMVNLEIEQIVWMCQQVRTILMSQPILLELEPPVKIVGDIHGQYLDLLRIMEYTGFPPESNYLFLGDYVDRGRQSIETICLLFAYKIKYPENFFLLRGNHECESISRIYGFFDECKRRYDVKLWKTFVDVFCCLPVAALVGERVFCMHGGLSKDFNSFQQIANICRPCDIPESGLLCDLLWSDPNMDITGWGPNDRGVSVTFGPDVITKFCQNYDIDLIVRAHQVVEDGYYFSAMRKLVTIFSAPNYCNEFNNAAGVLVIDENMQCSFQILQPAPKRNPHFKKRPRQAEAPTTSPSAKVKKI